METRGSDMIAEDETTLMKEANALEAPCPVCRSPGFAPFFSAKAQPALSCALYTSAEAARSCAKGAVALSVCRQCSYIGNTAYDSQLVEYDATYENALHFSSVYQDYLKRETETLVERYDLHGKRIVEIGCGDGRFLSLMCQLGDNTGVGYDPSFVADRHAAALHPNVRIETRYYEAADMRQGADLIASRQVLEHIPDPAAFLKTLREGLGEKARPVLSFEVPNAEYLIRDVAVWDVIYEHCNLFTGPALCKAFEVAGFEVLDVRRGFADQFLTVDAAVARPGARPIAFDEQVAVVVERVDRFADAAAARIADWSARMSAWRREGRCVAIWGAGARVVLFLNMVETPEAVDMVVDINPRKEGFHLPGTGHRIQAPGELAGFAPQTVLLMNPNYRNEVRKSLNDLGVTAELLVA